jgi:hypothetical protein
VCRARAWTDETNGAWGRKIRPVGGGSVLKGIGGEGARRGRRCMEAERERERGRGEAWVWCGVAWWRGIDVTAARPLRVRAACCRATV